MAMPIALSIMCGAALAVVLWAEHGGNKRGRYVFKPLASACFIAVAIVGGGWSHPLSEYARWLVIGLVLGAGGDVALMIRGKKAFLIGLVLFLLGHIAYVVACAQVVPVDQWLSPWMVLAVAFGAGMLAYLWRHLGNMRVPVIIYTTTIMLMLIGALAVWRADTALSGRASTLLLLGAAIFVASDVSVARQRFVSEGFVNRAWGLPAYYCGQLLIAWSTIVT